jgi:hypothetical protein
MSTQHRSTFNVFDKNRNLSKPLPTFDGYMKHAWRPVHMVKFVFERVNLVKIKVNFKDKFDIYVL